MGPDVSNSKAKKKNSRSIKRIFIAVHCAPILFFSIIALAAWYCSKSQLSKSTSSNSAARRWSCIFLDAFLSALCFFKSLTIFLDLVCIVIVSPLFVVCVARVVFATLTYQKIVIRHPSVKRSVYFIYFIFDYFFQGDFLAAKSQSGGKHA